ncbi:hypothetical protein CKO51_12020 [Rhodopirellula sp. SM50]|nr:Gfo/Idh/MocA family oxidoreductase [Rhodopirellula sp. SM50]PAY19332.1 hypothetical protein CKO51_12020 [Rhodopirellula sp. SM50]
MNPTKNLSVLVVGFGSIGNRHTQNLLAIGIDKITVLRRKTHNVAFSTPEPCRVVHDLSAAIKSAPDLAIICTPSSQHVSAATQLIAAGIPVLIEKPLHWQVDDDVRELVNLSQNSDAGRRSAMAYCMRYHNAYFTAATELADGRIGRCLYAKAWFEGYLPDWHPWEDHRQTYAARLDQAGGALRTLDHEIDFLNWTLGPAVESLGVRNNLGAIGIEADEVAHVISRHDENVSSQLTLAFCRKPASRGFEFIGTGGILRFDHVGNQLSHQHPSGKVDVLVTCDANDISEMYVALLNDFLAQSGVEAERPKRLPSIGAGVDCLRVIDSIGAS